MRDAIQALLDAPAEMIVTRHDDEVVFTSASGDVTRILVAGTKMKTTAGGAEHEVKASYRDGTLIVEYFFGEMKVVDTYRLVGDGARVTEFSGGPRRPGGGKPKPRRLVYDRTGTERNQALSGSIPSGAF